MDIKETEIYVAAKTASIGAEQSIINRQLNDAIKHLNIQIRILQNRLRELEESLPETFKYLRGNLNDERTTPNSNGEIIFNSGNNTIDIKTTGNVVDLRVRS